MNFKSLIVKKFGGTSIGTPQRIQAVADHISTSHAQGNQLVIVVSAMGKFTNEFTALANILCSSPPKRELDMLLSAGERISMALLAMALNKKGVPCRSFTGSQCGILTDSNHGNAKIERITAERIHLALENQQVAIVAGFQGVSAVEKEITTLGRGGSDLTAIAIAVTLKASKCEIFTDVNGVMSGDPRIINNPILYQHLDWQTMKDMAWSGASVIHHRAAHVAMKYKLPYDIRSSFHPDLPGTKISGMKTMEKPIVTALCLKSDCFQGCWHTEAPPHKALEWLWTQEESPVFWKTQKNSSDLWETQGVCSNKVAEDLDLFLTSLNVSVQIKAKQQNLAVISVIGQGFRQSPHLLSQIHEILNHEIIITEMLDSTIKIVVENDKGSESLKKLDALFFK